MGVIYHGTSSWSEKGWRGVFYPPGLPAGAWLAHYATQFPAVEADVTYYRVPDARTVGGWASKTPDGFRIAAKFPRSIVHAGEGPRPDTARLLVPDAVRGDTRAFLDAMALLGAKAGPLVLQFPYFNRGAFPSAEPFLARLDHFLGLLPANFRYAVEVRNRDWIDEPLLAVLRRHRVALVWVEIAYMPHPASLARRQDLVTTDFVYARLIGDRRATEARTETFDRVVLDMSSSLQRWAGLLASSRERVPETWAFANNHFAGFGPDTIRALRQAIEARAAGRGEAPGP